MSAYTKQQWRYLVEKEIQDINSIPNDAILKIQRPVKVQPIARVWYANENDKCNMLALFHFYRSVVIQNI